MTKFLKIAVGGVAVAAIAVGIGVGVGVHQKTKRNETAAANSVNENCRRLLVVPGVEDSFTYEAPSVRRKLLARSLGATLATPAPTPPSNLVETLENAWGGDGHHQVNPVKPSTVSKGATSKGAYHTPSNVSKGSKGTASTASVSKISKGAISSVSKVSKGTKTATVTDNKGSKGTKTATVTDSKGSKGKGTKTANVTGSKGSKKGSKIPVRIPRIFV